MEFSEEFKQKLHYMMAVIGGFMGAYALIERCDVFGNAQTSNLIHLAMSILGKDFLDILIRVCGIVIYMGAVALAVVWKKKINIDVRFAALIIDAFAVVTIGFFPENMNNMIALYPIFFAAAFQWTAFPGAFGYNCSTIFSTNNLKQFTMASVEYIMEHDEKQSHKAKFYAGTLICYHLGVAVAYIACKEFNIKAAWTAILPIMIAMFMMIWKMRNNTESGVKYKWKEMKMFASVSGSSR